jgi:hypothetical protein
LTVKLASLIGGPAAEGVKYSLAVLALQERRVDVLKYSLEQGGFPFEEHVRSEAGRVESYEDPKTFEILEESQYGLLYPMIRRQPCSGKCGAPPGVAAVFDKGGRLPVDW